MLQKFNLRGHFRELGSVLIGVSLQHKYLAFVYCSSLSAGAERIFSFN